MAMSMHSGRHDPRANRLLATLPPSMLDRLVPQLERVHADQGAVFVMADEPVERVYFPTSGLFSLLVLNGEGAAVEAAVVGREGMLGSAAVLGAPISTFQELCQVDDGLLGLPAIALQREFASEPSVRD